MKNLLIWKDPDAGKDWRQEEKQATEDEMIRWHHRLNGHEFEQDPGVGDGQGSLACSSPWDRKEYDITEQLNWTELNWTDNLRTLQEWRILKTAIEGYIYIYRNWSVVPCPFYIESQICTTVHGSQRVGHNWAREHTHMLITFQFYPNGSVGKESACNVGDPVWLLDKIYIIYINIMYIYII